MLIFEDMVKIIEICSEYDKRINAIKREGFETEHIAKTVNECIENLSNNIRSFVIYGEPQCGKTELMIALSARLIDEGKKIIIVLLNDDTDLLEQNLQRFCNSSINPTPVNYTHILDENLGTRKWIIFCKKNINDLQKLNNALDRISGKIIIDDEGDYASPNGKINKDTKTRINEQIHKLLNYHGIYIGVTATPARLDLNNTFENITEKWVRFKAHSKYTGKEVFFPINRDAKLKFSLRKLPRSGDKPELLRTALASFIVNISCLNVRNNENEKYSFLVHTSGEVGEHSKDRKDVNDYFEALNDKSNKNHKRYWEEIILIIKGKTMPIEKQSDVFKYAYSNISNKSVAVLNSKNKKNNVGVSTTNLNSLFSVFIGGNKVSRGITFNNLLGMFFTRDAKQKIQQDTYIQRARMFGNRLKYIEFFELWITENLYNDWRRCFIYHYLSLKSIETNGSAPVWIGDDRIRPAATQSIDKKTLVLDKGEMAFAKFKYSDDIESIFCEADKFKQLEILQKKIGEEALPSYVMSFIKTNSLNSNNDISIIKPRFVKDDDSEYARDLYRKRGTFGGTDINKNYTHHIMITHNNFGEARLIYYYSLDKVKFFKSEKG